MTTWYRTGTISMNTSATTESYLGVSYTGRQIVTAGSSAPYWSSSLLSIGEGIQLPDGRVYEIAALNEAAQKIYLSNEYNSTSFTNQAYEILPMQGYIKSLANRAAELVASYGTAVDSALAGKFGDGTVSEPGISYVSDTDTGIRRTASGTQAVVANGVDVATFSSAGLAATTIDTTNLEVTNIKAKDGTATVTLSDSSGNVAISKNVTLGDASTDTVTVNGYIGVGGAGDSAYGIRVTSNALTGTGQIGAYLFPTITSSSTSYGVGVAGHVGTQAAAFTVAEASAIRAFDAIKGSGSTITNQHGVYIADQTQGTNNYGVTSLVSSGTNKWNIYASGTAANYFAGNVLLGTTTAYSWANNFNPVLRLGSGGYVAGRTPGASYDEIYVGTNAYNDGAWKYSVDGFALQYYQDSGQHVFRSAASGLAGNAITFNERFAINQSEAVFNGPGNDYDFRIESYTNTHALFVQGSDGFVGIGASAPVTSEKVQIRVTSDGTVPNTLRLVNSGTSVGSGNRVLFGAYTNSSSYVNAGYIDVVSSDTTSGYMAFGTSTSGSLTERMRLDSSGNLLVGTTSSSGGKVAISFNNASQRGIDFYPQSSSYNGSALQFYNVSSTSVGYVLTNATSTTYATSSDYRLKEDFQPVATPIDRLNELKPVNFAWKVGGSRCDGFLAHELQEVIPEAATGTKDETKIEEYEVSPAEYETITIPAVLDEEGNEVEPERTEQKLIKEAVMGEREVPVYQGIDQSKIVPLLTAALQEAVAKIESLTERIAALENKGA